LKENHVGHVLLNEGDDFHPRYIVVESPDAGETFQDPRRFPGDDFTPLIAERQGVRNTFIDRG
jgi:hypothetical protein